MRRLIPAIVLLLPPHLHAQTKDPVLTLTTASGQTTFHIGERIPIVFSFTGPDTGGLIFGMSLGYSTARGVGHQEGTVPV